MQVEQSGKLMATFPVSPIATMPSSPTLSTVQEVQSLHDIPLTFVCNTLVLCDLDDTLFDTPYNHMVGSKKWRAYISEAAKNIDPLINWHDHFSLFLATQKYPLQTIEATTSHFIRELQQDYVVCGLTARERNKWYDLSHKGIDVLTTRQLNAVSIDFNNLKLETTYPALSRDMEYYQGTFFANTDLKGEYLLKLLRETSDIPHILFIDDKRGQVESVHAALTQLQIPHTCFLYTASETKAKGFNPLIANIQLHAFYTSGGKQILSDDQAARVAQSNLDKSAEEYLRETIEFAKRKVKGIEEQKI